MFLVDTRRSRGLDLSPRALGRLRASYMSCTSVGKKCTDLQTVGRPLEYKPLRISTMISGRTVAPLLREVDT
jgi:hypothetical protein